VAVFKIRSRVNSDGRVISPNPVFKPTFEIRYFYVEGKANSEKTLLMAIATSYGGSRKKDPERERGGALGGLGRRKWGKRPLRASELIPQTMFVGWFRNPEAAFPAAKGLKFREAVRPRNDPREA
jgi:hypothetical protein